MLDSHIVETKAVRHSVKILASPDSMMCLWPLYIVFTCSCSICDIDPMIRFTQMSYTVTEDGTMDVCAELFNILAPPLPVIMVDMNFATNTAGMLSCCYGGWLRD